MRPSKSIFEVKANYNKWLNELTESEKQLVMDMLDESFEKGIYEAVELIDANVDEFIDANDRSLLNFIRRELIHYL